MSLGALPQVDPIENPVQFATAQGGAMLGQPFSARLRGWKSRDGGSSHGRDCHFDNPPLYFIRVPSHRIFYDEARGTRGV